MGMARGTALVADVGHVTRLTGKTGLLRLEVPEELSLPDLLVACSDAIYDRLEADGIDPTALTTAAIYEAAVAYTFLARLAAQKLINAKDDQAVETFQRLADEAYERVKPRTSGNTPATTRDGLPTVFNPGCTEAVRFWEGIR